MQSLTHQRNSKFVLLGYFAVIVAALLSGLIPSVSKPALQGVNPILFTAVVTLAPAALFTPLSARATTDNKHIRKWGLVILALTAIAGAMLAPYLYFLGLQQTQATSAALLGNGEMVFTVLLASLYFGERLSPKGMFAMILIAIGIIIAVTNLNFSGSVLNFSSPGNLLILGATFLWGLDNNVTSAIAERVTVAKIVQLKALIAGTCLLLIAWLTNSFSRINDLDLVYVAVLGLVVFSGSAFLSIQSLKRLGAIRTTIVFPLSSLFGLAFAVILLREEITIFQLFSIGLIVLGINILVKRNSVKREGIVLEQY